VSLPTGTVTFLFTDIEGSTRLWEAHGAAMAAALARHDGIVREAIAAHGGQVFKHTGDGVCVVFAAAPDAVAAALDAQRALERESWDDIGALRVRMALHTGTAELRGEDYYGPTLNRCARLLAAAHGGQVLLTRTTADLTRDGLPGDGALHDLGAHRLRDIEQPVGRPLGRSGAGARHRRAAITARRSLRRRRR
jgi:class 3 adenylate cyclase